MHINDCGHSARFCQQHEWVIYFEFARETVSFTYKEGIPFPTAGTEIATYLNYSLSRILTLGLN